jgi:UDP-N-acetylmuramoylalanine--D-glutamate ligase
LKKTKGVDYAVFELDSWQLQGFGDSKISPHVSVFTTFFSDHLNYYKNNLEHYFSDKAKIFQNQKATDFLIVGRQAESFIKKWGINIKARLIVPKEKLPKDFAINIPGVHNEYNAMLALSVAKCLNISDSIIKKALKSFEPVEGRLEYLKSVKGIKIYNDNNSTTPEATMVALQALGNDKRNIVLIMGGADKNLDMRSLIVQIKKYCKKVIMLSGTGSDRLDLKDSIKVSSLKEAVSQAVLASKRGDTILFSPAFASFGLFINEYERNDQFVKIIKSL